MLKKPGTPAILAVLIVGSALSACDHFGGGQDYSHVRSVREAPWFQDAKLLEDAYQLPVAARYQAGPLEPQKNASFCGPASLVNMLRSIDQKSSQDTILDKSTMFTIFGFLPGGLTLDALAALSRNQIKSLGYTLNVLRGVDLAQFRSEIEKSNDPRRRLIVNFHRGPLFGHGGGHHSPIGGYIKERDLVLVLDVNESYQPWLVPTERLFEAVDTIDPATKKKRGLLVFVKTSTATE